MKKSDPLHYATILLIDSTDRDQTALALITDQDCLIVTAKETRAQELPTLIDELLKKAKILPANLKALAIVKRDGSMTAIRIGTAVANTLAWLQRIPIIEVEAQTFDEAITKIKSGQLERVVKISRPAV